MKQASITGLLAVAIVSLSVPAAAGDDINERRSISVSGSGTATGSPDQARISAGVATQAPSPIDAATENQAAVRRVMQALAKQNVNKKDIQTSNYGIWPIQQHDPRGDSEPTITGYRVNNTVSVLVRDLDRIGELLAALTNAGANSIGGIEFGFADSAALQAQARAEAMADARKNAEELATHAGVQLGEVLSISMSAGGGRPMPMADARFNMLGAAPEPDISAGQLSVQAQVQVVYAIR